MDNLNSISQEVATNVVQFPLKAIDLAPVTPVYDELAEEAAKLDSLSKYECSFDYKTYRDLELRYKDRKIHGGPVLKTVFRMANFHSTCQQCLYTFEIDTYGRGCVHDCAYCYAKAELTVHGMWNNPIPAPANLNEIRKAFYQAFETDRSNKWTELLRKRIPLRIGSMSDSFMWLDQKYKVTQELLKILNFYQYPHVIFTRSDLVATDDYMKLLDPKLSAVQFSISSLNEPLIRKMEPGAPSAKRRLLALQKLSKAGFWTTVRINPLFPIYPDGYFTDPSFSWQGEVPKFEYSSFDMIEEIAAHGVPAVLAGFGRFSKISLNAVERALGENLRQYFNHGNRHDPTWRDYKFSDREIRFYYEELKKKSDACGIQFTTCYIGNGEPHFWKNQDLWSNSKDCCNIKQRLPTFQSDSREVTFDKRLKYTTHKDLKATSDHLHTLLGEPRPPLLETPAPNEVSLT
jgi:DNA repair photolyase